MTLFFIIALGVFILGATIAFMAFDKREYQLAIIGLIVACIPLVLSYNLYHEKIAENAKYEARR
ncbi:hypothetical protein INVICTA_168 [Cronobacter phage vB_CsaM_Invicta]|uniref:Uncharacterized protein n=1 Tax=Cronobacter phage vB_CsaM_SemperBestia TaxID=2777353 RepID=A0A7T3TLM6_9CAUD|nr:hypothetical protein [Cronobacter phage vB_CsaM_Cronuts]QPX76466.1 hypothetical protein [Cronobacter phage vB_CsaM_SemperBestia]UGO54575.1 hypothetical protein BANACH_194 [Cronobacter phage vB_CsaD_Banach]UGV22935.1 hypothetical protein INVICTA_168 [Cronobacter phage vB_CsaM_Invicta]